MMVTSFSCQFRSRTFLGYLKTMQEANNKRRFSLRQLPGNICRCLAVYPVFWEQLLRL